MSKIRFTLIALSIFFTTISQAQTSGSRNKIGIQIGYNLGAYKNLILSPVVRYQFNNPVYEVSYSRKTKKNRLMSFRVKHMKSTLESDKAPQLNLDYTNTSFRFEYLFPVMQKDKISIHTGFLSQTTQAAFGAPYAAEIQQKAALAGKFRYKLNAKHALSAELFIPVFLFLYGNLDIDLYSFRRYQSYNFTLNYDYSLSDSFDLTLRYFSNYDSVQSNNVFRELQDQITLGINFNF